MDRLMRSITKRENEQNDTKYDNTTTDFYCYVYRLFIVIPK